MKAPLSSLLFAGMFSLCLIASPAVANDNETKRPTASTAWVTTPNESLAVRTYQANDRHLVVQISNKAQRPVSVILRAMDGNELGFYPISKRDAAKAVKFDVSDLTDGAYRLEVLSGTDKITKTVQLNTPVRPMRQADIAVAE